MTADSPLGSPSRRRPVAGIIVASIMVVVIAVVAAFLLLDDDGDGAGEPGGTSDTTTGSPATTQNPVTTESPATTEQPPTDDTAWAIWPWVDTSTRYADPVEAATGFATDYLGFVDPIVGDYRAGDSRSGEVEIRTFATGPATTVLVRQLGDDDSWWILGAVTEHITIDEPAAGAEVVSPLTVSGSALAFEGTVDVELRADGNGEPIFVGFVTGSGGPEAGPFGETFEFASPGDTGGALVLLSRGSEDGSVLEAAALRLFYR